MTTRQQAIEAFTPMVADIIGKWMDETVETHEHLWEPMGYIGDDAARLMAKAAMAVLEGSADVQDMLRRDGDLDA